LGRGGLCTPAMTASRFTDASHFEAAGSHCEGPGFGEGRAPHARLTRLCFHPVDRPVRPPAYHQRTGAIMICLGLRMASPRGRTECVPPRKPAPGVIPGFPRKAIPARMTNPAEGRALHARNGTIAPPRHVPGWPPRHRQPSGQNEMPSLASGPYSRARRPRPSEKPPLALSPGFPREAILPWMAHPLGGAGSARSQMRPCFHRWIAPLGHRHIINGPAQMICLGLRMASPRGRGDRAPPKNHP
jgi:hypothetical protein